MADCKTPEIPFASGVEQNLQRVLAPIKETLDVWAGRIGDPLCRVVTIEDLLDEAVTVNITSTGGGGTDNFTLKVSSNDSTPGYLEDKFIVSHGTNTTNPLELSTLNDGTDEDRQLQFDEAKVDHDQLLNFLAAEHIDWVVTGAEDVHVDRITASAITQHEGSINHSNLLNLTTGDPHTQYQLESEKSAANGYASLGVATLVPTAELGTGSASSANFLRGDQTWAVPVGSGDVSKVGTPVDDQVGVWTGDGTIEGTVGLTYDGIALDISGNITLSGMVDGIDIATDVAANTLKVTNATHTGEVTGSGALALDNTSISNKSIVTALGSDYVLIGDTSDSNNLKRALISDFASVGGDMTAATYDPTTIAADCFDMDNMVEGVTTKILTATERSEIAANTSKVTNADHTGEVTGNAALTIAADAVTYAKMQNVSATDRILGRVTVGAGNVEEITCTAAGRAILDDADAAAQRTTLDVDQSGTDNSTDVTLAGTPNYITIAGQVITRVQIDLTTDVTGLLPDANIDAAIARDSELSAHTGNTSNPHTVTKTQVSLGDVENLKVNLVGTAAPAAATDDVTLGYSVGSRWFDITNDKEYVCLDNTDGAAVWTETTASGVGAHTIASHSDTTATGAELETLTNNSIADTLHRHSELVASDGSPDPALSVDADGKVSLVNGTGINEFSTDGTLAGDSDDAVPTEKAVATAIAASKRKYVKVSDVKSSTTAGGDFNTGAWRTRTLNTEDSDTDSICSLSSNQIMLSAGTYECRISAPALQVQDHKIKLRNVTGSTDILIGTSEFGLSSNSYAQTRSFIVGKFTIAASQALEVQHYCGATKTTSGFGYPCGFGVSEVYTVAEFWKVS